MTNTTETKPFGVAVILTAITDVLMCDFGDVHELLDWMTSDTLLTHQLPRASDECTPLLRATFPDLATLEVPVWSDMEDWDRVDVDGKKWIIGDWIAGIPGDSVRQVPRLPAGDHTLIDPVSELRMMKPDLPIVVIGPEADR